MASSNGAPGKPRFQFRTRLALAFGCLTVGMSLGTTLFAYQAALASLRRSLSGELTAIAAVGALRLDGNRVAALARGASPADPAYRQHVDLLREIKVASPHLTVRYVYTIHRDSHGRWVYLGDAEPPTSADFSPPGTIEPEPPTVLTQALTAPAALPTFERSERWGSLLSAAAPIRDAQGHTVALLGVDATPEDYWALSRTFRIEIALALLVSTLLSLLVAGWISRSLTRPITLLSAAAEAVARGDFEHEVRVASEDELGLLAQTFQKMADDVREREEGLHQAKLDTLDRLALAAEYKDQDTAAHIHRMSHYAAVLARRAGLPEDEVELLLLASPMHDVGKIGIPDRVLLKPGALTDDEWGVMKQHTTMGSRILEGSSSELLRAAEVIARSHHERWDGQGYPLGLAAESIPLWGRICAIADVFDALTSERPYKPAFSVERAVELLREGRGTHFDPVLLDLFLSDLDEILEIRDRFADLPQHHGPVAMEMQS
ncbi:MAG: HD domain-containing protein [Armatimonadetes bacterium]|nr:HD domain-containing protein [Armatimonadota bacterium]